MLERQRAPGLRHGIARELRKQQSILEREIAELERGLIDLRLAVAADHSASSQERRPHLGGLHLLSALLSAGLVLAPARNRVYRAGNGREHVSAMRNHGVCQKITPPTGAPPR